MIMTELDVFAHILAYVAENKILAGLEAESQQIIGVEAIKLEKSRVINLDLSAKQQLQKARG